MILPVVNIILLYFLGFSDWPVLKELKASRRNTGLVVTPMEGLEPRPRSSQMALCPFYNGPGYPEVECDSESQSDCI